MMAAYEATVQRGAKDESAWRRMRTQLYMEPPEVKQQRLRSDPSTKKAPSPGGGMTIDSVQALLASAAAKDAQYGAS